MRKSYSIRDKRNRLLFFKLEKKLLFLKVIIQDQRLSLNLREWARFYLLNMPKNSSLVRIRNRCVYTGESGFPIRYFRLSRHMFKRLAEAGELVGVKKSSW
jgi:succinate dehydrogenase (ubiquinone) iron-sulfur subunit